MGAIGKGNFSISNLKTIMMNIAVNTETKELLHYPIVLTLLTYGGEAWML